MNYSGIIKNDIANGPGVRVSVFLQGCDKKCDGCFNPETWDENGGKPFTDETMKEIIEAISANNIKRNLSILGGEPLNKNNKVLTRKIISEVKKVYPDINIYLWTGYYIADLENDEDINFICCNVDKIIDGPYLKNLRRLDLYLRGSANQRIIDSSVFANTKLVERFA